MNSPVGERLPFCGCAKSDRTPTRETSITRALVMSRERAEREGREILRPADVAAADDFVRINPESLILPLAVSDER